MADQYAAKQTPLADLIESDRRCWKTGCKRTARLENMGWRYCLWHYWTQVLRDQETWANFITTLRYTRIARRKYTAAMVDKEGEAAFDKLASLLRWKMDSLDAVDDSRDWAELDDSERDFYRICVRRLLNEVELVHRALFYTGFPTGYFPEQAMTKPSQTTKRGRSLTDAERASNLLAALQRCDRCDNGIDLKWYYCAWCGHQLIEPDDETLRRATPGERSIRDWTTPLA